MKHNALTGTIMIAVDTSTLVAFIQGEAAEYVHLVRKAINDENLIMPPFVVTERFSALNLSDKVNEAILGLPQ